MKRLILADLKKWKESNKRKPLLVRGARQVGKTWAIEALAKTFRSCIEINFELTPSFARIFNHDLDPHRILREIETLKKQQTIPGQTLLFFDEIQIAPKAIQALRYFYEKIPDLHVIAAGSLVEFVLEKTGLPVGRVDSIYLRPMSFLEFLAALDHTALIEELISDRPQSETVHDHCMQLFGDYLFVGGMPEVVEQWAQTQDVEGCRTLQQQLIAAYRSDFHKYAKNSQYKYLDLLIEAIPPSVGKKFVFSKVASGVRKRDVDPCVDLLVRAGILHKVFHTSARKPPLAAGMYPDRYKLIMGDVGLLSATARHSPHMPWEALWNKGNVIESVIGQECLVYQNPAYPDGLYYWYRSVSSAEIDYLIECNGDAVPIEVKSGDGRSLKSLKSFIEGSEESTTGYRLSAELASDGNTIKNLPLYAVCKLFEKPLRERISELLG